jgi:ABC-type multidrug transport system permease subunit
MTRLVDWRQSAILSDRYLDVLAGEPGSVFVLLLQAPIIGGLCAVVWGHPSQATPATFFVLALTGVWLGCINACREVVKERAVLDRERLTGLGVGAYLLSKFKVLSLLNAAQLVILLGMVEWYVHPPGNLAVQCAAVFLAAEAGTALGLLVSCVASRQDRAVFAVPILILPQILFSEFVLPRESFGTGMKWGERFMPVHWAFDAMKENAQSTPDHWRTAGDVVALTAFVPVFLVLAWVALGAQRPRV